VIPNAATERWLARERWLRLANRVSAPVVSRLPAALQDRSLRFQRPSMPFFSPQPPTDDGPVALLDAGPLYAGANVGRIGDVRPAAELVRELAP
jgi:hypothetical protein